MMLLRRTLDLFRRLYIVKKRLNFATSSEFVLKSKIPDIDIPKITIPELIWKNLDEKANNIATVSTLL